MINNFHNSNLEYDKYANIQLENSQRLYTFILQRTNILPTTTIFDVGCGTGFMSRFFSNTRLTCLDSSNVMIQIAKQKIPNANFICSNFLDFNSEIPFDIMVSNFAFQWTESFERWVLKAQSIAKKSYISFPIYGSLPELEKHNIHANFSFMTQEFIVETLNKMNIKFEHETCETQEKFDNPLLFLKSLKKIGANIINDSQNIKYILNLARNKELFMAKYRIIILAI